jgi:hypothetical protein
MFQNRLVILVPAVLMLLAVSSASAAPCGCCSPSNGCGEVQMVEKTICVPEWVTETRKCTVTECVAEEKEVKVKVMVPKIVEETVKVCEMVQEKKVVEVKVCKPVSKQVTKEVTVCVPVMVEKEQKCTVLVPTEEIRKGVRKVCKMVSEKKMVTVKKDCGHWETQMVEVPCRQLLRCRRSCGGCGSCGSCCEPCAPKTRTVCKKVWVPKIVEEQVEVTCCKRVIVEEPYECKVIVCKPQEKVTKVKVCQMQQKKETRTFTECSYETVVEKKEIVCCVPKTVEKKVQVTKCVCEEQIKKCKVMVPKQVEKEVQVKVCKMVEKKVTVPACQSKGCGRALCRRSCCGC